ncbi:MAG: DMT family transporter [Patescibacteria group bacterium]|nr:DMT family transporter [Patescibacteria group bacterium]
MKKGIIFAILTACISGFSIFYNKQVIVSGIDPFVFNITHNGGVALILSLIILASGRKKILTGLSVSSWKKLFLIGLVGGSLPFMLYFEGLRTVAAINANLIHKTLFVWVALMAIPILGERLNIWQTAGYTFLLLSNLFIGGFHGFQASTGELLIFSATLLWSAENVIAKITLSGVDADIVAWGRMFFGTIILIAFSIPMQKFGLLFNLPTAYIIPLTVSTLFLTGYVLTWYKALKYAPATIVSSILVLATPITNILSLVANHQSFVISQQMISTLLTFLGVTFITLLMSNKRKTEFIPDLLSK